MLFKKNIVEYNCKTIKRGGKKKMDKKSFLQMILEEKETTKLLKTSEIIFLGLTKTGRLLYYYQFGNHFGSFSCNKNFKNIRFKKGE